MTPRSAKPLGWEVELTGKLKVFVDQWREFRGTEQSGAQQFLNGLLEIYEADFRPGTIFEQHPIRLRAQAPKGRQATLFGSEAAPAFTTERMDMYLPKICVWEMKAPGEKQLEKHHDQLLNYWARMRTRYMVLCNFHEFWIYDTDDENGQLAPKLTFRLDELPSRGDALLFLRGEQANLSTRGERVTAAVAERLGRLLRSLIDASPSPARDRERIAKLVLECVFAMFAEDTDLVPPRIFTDAMRMAKETGRMDPVWTLFDDFARQDPRERSNRFAPYVNGPLFDRNHPKIQLAPDQIHEIYCAAKDFEWDEVRPEIFGSIFEQALSDVQRHELGAHFTREIDIARVVGPTVIEPWRRRIESIRSPKDAARVIEEMRAFHVLDPACGCGNFLYVVYREMKRLEVALTRKWTEMQLKVAKRRSAVAPPPAGPYFTIRQLHGIEIDPFAAFLARVVLWIGEHLAQRELGLDEPTLPLKKLDDVVVHDDALLIDWPRPEGELAIVGNPPYLGVRKMRAELGDEYVDQLFAKYPDNRAADFVTYWFPRALHVLRNGERAGFVCTNSIAQNESREASIDKVLAAGGTITDAWKSYPWPGDAAVHVSIVNWVMAAYDGMRTLDGTEANSISASLTRSIDVTRAQGIRSNESLCFMGVTVGTEGFVLDDEQRDEIVRADPKSASVIRRYLIGRDVNREVDQRPSRWIVDFGSLDKAAAEEFVGAMRHVRKFVYPVRKENPREKDFKNWWQFWRAAPNLRQAIGTTGRVIVLPRVSPHLIVSRQDANVCFDGQVMVVALDGAYFFGLLQSRTHAAWAWARGSTLEERLRYTNTTIFETFPFPNPDGGPYDPRVVPKAKSAAKLAAAAEAFEAERARACTERQLGLTKVHNLLRAGELPELQRAYEAMNDAVDACYGFPAGTWHDEKETLRRLLELNHRLTAASLPRA